MGAIVVFAVFVYTFYAAAEKRISEGTEMSGVPPIESNSANGSPDANLKPAAAKQGMSRLTVVALGCWIFFLVLIAFGLAGMYLLYRNLENWNPG
jgi:hypothetical protein